MALVDSDSFYISGYFDETKLPRIGEGDRVRVELMSGETFGGTVQKHRFCYCRPRKLPRQSPAETPRQPVGASLLAKAVGQATSMLAVLPSSRASSLLQGYVLN